MPPTVSDRAHEASSWKVRRSLLCRPGASAITVGWRTIEIADKRRDYFAAGTLVVWDVDVLRLEVIRAYRATDPDHPTTHHRGEGAEAEPAVPG